ncbi:MAG: phosphohistidine phosphatase [Crocinitomicaceae bacterium]|nr:phosphohistidine phosphatase [Crocinitomicaceae bacterium]|tara:strand:+ start:11986 stop:12498 length:513 start_codon:yes stop_codon:yes gene_type:complete
MKSLFIARHGKSSWVHSELKDIDRSLDISGIEGVYSVAGSMKNQGVKIDKLISSPATRAIHTALIHSRVLEYPENQITIESSVYYRGEMELLKLIDQQESDIESLMFCGHNPTSTNFVNQFLKSPILNLQTSGVVRLDFEIKHWAELKHTSPIGATYFKRNSIKDLSNGK